MTSRKSGRIIISSIKLISFNPSLMVTVKRVPEFRHPHRCPAHCQRELFSGLNNLRVCSILDNAYADVMGFTEEEITQIAKDTNEEQALPALKKWYDGYRFGNIDIYNPWSIINFFAERTADDYWVNTSSNDIIQHMMQGNAKSQEKNLLTLLHGGTVAAIIREGLIYKDITQNKDGLYTLLLMTGYLTAVQNTTVPNGHLCQLRIPNEELTHVFQSEVLNLEPFSKSKSSSISLNSSRNRYPQS